MEEEQQNRGGRPKIIRTQEQKAAKHLMILLKNRLIDFTAQWEEEDE